MNTTGSGVFAVLSNGLKHHKLLLIGFLLILFFFKLGSRGLNEPDEGRYANIAQEALEGDHDWTDPQMTDMGHYDKPPLIYWVTALSFYVFGMHEWAARLPSVFGALLTLSGLGWTAYRLYGQRIAWWTILMAGTLFHIWALARVLTPDMMLTGWTTLAIAAWAETKSRSGKGKGLGWSLQILFWTLAWWTKATPMLVPMAGLALFVYLGNEPEGRKALKLPFLLPIVLILGLPWFIVMMQKHPELKDFFLHREMEGRITGHVDGRRGPFYYYFLISLITWLPWWPLAVMAFFKQRQMIFSKPMDWRKSMGLELYIVVSGLFIFSCIASKLPTYTVIVAPWAALVMARLICKEPMVLKPLFVKGVAVVFAFIYLGTTFLVPFYESRLQRNSSLKQVAAYLESQGAGIVHADRYWPGLEFYWGEDVRFTGIAAPKELRDDTQGALKHFEDSPALPPGSNDWFIHYRKESNSPFKKWLSDPSVKTHQIGDFEVGRFK